MSAETPREAEPLYKELDSLVRVVSDYVVRLEAACFHNAEHFFVFEFADQGSLGQMLRRDALKAVPLRTRLQWAKDVAVGLRDLHTLKLAHRDLKPDNVLLFTKPERTVAKIADLGLAKHADASRMSTERGTRRYMAPEVRVSGLGYDERCDVFGLGLVLWELA